MMYILSEQEYGDLRKKQALDFKVKKDELQAICPSDRKSWSK